MSLPPVIPLAIVALATVFIGALWREKRPAPGFRGQARPLATDAEREMFHRLVAAHPEGVVLVKVALAALLSVPLHERGRVRHRHVDFVLCDRDLGVLGAVQLDESEELQAFRVGESARAMLEAAGYRVLAWDEPPSVDELRAAIAPWVADGPRGLRTDAYAPRPSDR